VTLLLLAGLLVVTLAGVVQILHELRRRRREAAVQRIIATFGDAAARAPGDARQLLAWYPLAAAMRRLFPAEFAQIDRALGAPFPFGPEQVQAAHARWTADWLAWERAHDLEYKLKASALEQELERKGEAATSVGRARLQQIEREQLERYQQRYEEYVRVAKALQGIMGDRDR
jgi:hypothetical protein